MKPLSRRNLLGLRAPREGFLDRFYAKRPAPGVERIEVRVRPELVGVVETVNTGSGRVRRKKG